jgi:hypothetical protein
VVFGGSDSHGGTGASGSCGTATRACPALGTPLSTNSIVGCEIVGNPALTPVPASRLAVASPAPESPLEPESAPASSPSPASPASPAPAPPVAGGGLNPDISKDVIGSVSAVTATAVPSCVSAIPNGSPGSVSCRVLPAAVVLVWCSPSQSKFDAL